MPNGVRPDNRFVRNILEALARGGLQGGAPDDPATPPAPPAAPPAAPAPAPTPTPAPASATPPAPAAPADLLEHYRTTIVALTKTVDDLKSSGTATTKQLKDATDALEGFRKVEADRATALFGALPEANRKKLEPFKDKLQLADWIGLLGAEQAAVAALSPSGGTVLPPPTGSPVAPGAQPTDKHTPTALASRILKDNMIGEEMLRSLTVKRFGDQEGEDSKGEPKFTMDDLRDFFGRMKKPQIQTISLKSANARDNG